jgi:hypothetical protein
MMREESTELREARKQIRLLQQENEVLRRAAAYLSQAWTPKSFAICAMVMPSSRDRATRTTSSRNSRG